MEEIQTEETITPEKKPESVAKSRVKKAWNRFTTILTAAIVLTSVYCGLGVWHQNNTGELFFPFGHRAVKILSGSMEDTLKTGSIVVVKDTKDVEEGDIIFFLTEDRVPVIHRYIDTDENGNMITKGDNNPKEDLETVTPQRLLGKVTKTANWLAEPLNFINWMLNKIR